MFEGDFTHEGDRCTFEVICGRFALTDPRLRDLAELVHDLDLKDARFGRVDAPLLGALVEGLAAAVRRRRGAAGAGHRALRGAVRRAHRVAAVPRPDAPPGRRREARARVAPSPTCATRSIVECGRARLLQLCHVPRARPAALRAGTGCLPGDGRRRGRRLHADGRRPQVPGWRPVGHPRPTGACCLAGAVVFAVLPLSYLAVGGLVALVAVRVIHGSATALFGPVASATLSDLAPPDSARAMAQRVLNAPGRGTDDGPGALDGRDRGRRLLAAPSS